MDFERMVGSSGQMDYLIVARNKGVGLGVKFVSAEPFGIGTDKAGIVFSFRIRSALVTPKPTEEAVDALDALKELASVSEPQLNVAMAWNDMDWSKVSHASNGDAYASTVVGLRYPIQSASIALLEQSQKDFSINPVLEYLVKYLNKHVPAEQLQVTTEVLAAFFAENFEQYVDHCFKSIIHAVSSVENAALPTDGFVAMGKLLSKKASEYGLPTDGGEQDHDADDDLI